MNEIISNTRVEGRILIDNVDVYESGVDLVQLRRRAGMVFQKLTEDYVTGRFG